MEETWISILTHPVYPWLLCILVFALAERLFPRFPSQHTWRKGSGENLFWLVLNELFNHAWARIGGVLLLLRLTGLGPFLRGHFAFLESFSHWSFWPQFFFIFFLADFLGWLLHAFVHRNRFLSRFHVLHHSTESLDWLASFRGHWIDSTFLDLNVTLPLAILPVNDRIMVVFGFLALLQAFYNHSNTRIGIRSGRPVWKQVFGWIGSPMAHHWHHAAVNRLPHGQNFGFYTLIWDRLFGTLYLPDEKPPERFGLFHSREYTPGILKRFIGPFLPGASDLMENPRA